MPEPSMSPSSPSLKSERPNLVLASGSPRRRELLTSLGLDFTIISPPLDEKAIDVTGLSPCERALRLAREKGRSVAVHHSHALVIASDTIVVIGDEVLEKPEDEDDAFRMLQRLQGHRHTVVSAIALFHQEAVQAEALETQVWMKPLSEDEIRAYIQTGEPMDKAGSYAIQGVGSVLIERVDGCYFNVVGMSLFLLNKMCQQWGFPLGITV